mgnify:CR=1 FL=1
MAQNNNHKRNNRGRLSSSLRKAFEKPGCSLCRLQREMEERWLWQVFYELTRDREIRDEFDRSSGLCTRHSRLAFAVIEERELIGGHNLARIYGTVIQRLSDRALNFKRSGPLDISQSLLPRLLRGTKFDNSDEVDDCPLCRRIYRISGDHARTFLDCIESEEELQRYRESDGLCDPHFGKVLQVVEDDSQRKIIVKDHSRRLELLKANLESLMKKRRYDSDSEISPEESQSWREALWRCSGMVFDTTLINRQPA